MSVATGRARQGSRGEHADRLERESESFFERIDAGYRAVAAAEPGRIRVLDASVGVERLHEAALVELADLLGGQDGA